MIALLASLLAASSSPAFCLIVAEDSSDHIAILSPGGDVLRRVDVGHWPHEVEVDGSGATAYVTQFGITDYDSRLGTPGDRVTRVDLASASETGRISLPDGRRGPHGVKLRPSGNELFVNTEAGGDQMLVYDASSLALLRQFALPKATHNFIFSADGRYLFSFAGGGGVTKVDPASGAELATRVFDSPARGLRWTKDGDLAVAAKGEVVLLDPDNLATRKTLRAPVGGQRVYLETLSDGTIVAPSMADDGVVWFAKGQARLIPTGKAALTARLAPDGLIYVTNVDDDHLTVLDHSGAVVRQIGSGLKGPNGLGFGKCPAPAPAGPERG